MWLLEFYLTLHLTPDALYCKYIKTGRLNPTISPALGFTTAIVDNRNDVQANEKCNSILAGLGPFLDDSLNSRIARSVRDFGIFPALSCVCLVCFFPCNVCLHSPEI